jgi:hypothetical protein
MGNATEISRLRPPVGRPRVDVDVWTFHARKQMEAELAPHALQVC